MADQSQILKILLQVQADISELQGKLNPALAQTAAQLESATVAGGELSGVLAGALGGAAFAAVTAIATAVAGIPTLIGQAGEELVRATEEQKRLNEELDKQVAKWITLAKVAKDAGDVIKLGGSIVGALDAAEQRFDEFQKKQLEGWDVLKNSLTSIPFLSPEGVLQQKLDAEKTGSESDLRKLLADFRALLDLSTETATAFQRIKTEPLADGIAEVTARVTILKAQVALLDQQSIVPPGAKAEELKKAADAAGNFIEKSKELGFWNSALQELQKELQKTTDKLNDVAFSATTAFQKVQSQIRLNLAEATGDTAGALNERLDRLRSDTFNQLFKGDNAVEASRAAEQLVNSERLKAQYAEQSKTAALGERDAHKDLSVALQEESQLLRDIRVQQQLIAESPFLSADAKMAALHQALIDERSELIKNVTAWQARLAAMQNDGSPKARAEIDRVIAKLHDLDAALQHNANQLKVTTFGGDLKKNLADWVNSFGSAGQQIGNLIQGSINVGLQGTNQLLTGLITGTGNWKQTLVQAEAQIASLFLTWIEQMALQRLAQLLGITTTTTAQVASGGAIAAAHAPAAAASSVSSFGAAAIIGEVLAVAAIAAIIAAIGGGFASGGRIPGVPSSSDNVLLPMATGEHIINARAAQWADHTLGPDFLPSLNAMRISFPGAAAGGRVGPLPISSSLSGASLSGARGDIHIFNFTDPRALQKAFEKSTAFKKMIVNTVNSRGGRLRA
jgi:hypothetical protein